MNHQTIEQLFSRQWQGDEVIQDIIGRVTLVGRPKQPTEGQAKYGIHPQYIKIVSSKGAELDIQITHQEKHFDPDMMGRIVVLESVDYQDGKGIRGLQTNVYGGKLSLKFDKDGRAYEPQPPSASKAPQPTAPASSPHPAQRPPSPSPPPAPTLGEGGPTGSEAQIILDQILAHQDGLLKLFDRLRNYISRASAPPENGGEPEWLNHQTRWGRLGDLDPSTRDKFIAYHIGYTGDDPAFQQDNQVAMKAQNRYNVSWCHLFDIWSAAKKFLEKMDRTALSKKMEEFCEATVGTGADREGAAMSIMLGKEQFLNHLGKP